MGQTSPSDTRLVDALRALQGATDELSRRRARSRLADVVSDPVMRLVRKRLPDEQQAFEVAQDAIMAIVLDKPHLCRAPQIADPMHAERAAWAWVVSLVQRRVFDAARRVSTERSRLAEEGALEPAAVPTEDDSPPLEYMLGEAERGARELIETRQPKDLYEEARKGGVASTVDGVARDIDSWRQVKVHGRRCLQVGRERGIEGPDSRLQNQISKQVERGKKALHYGALVAAARAGEPEERELMERFAHGLMGTEKE